MLSHLFWVGQWPALDVAARLVDVVQHQAVVEGVYLPHEDLGDRRHEAQLSAQPSEQLSDRQQARLGLPVHGAAYLHIDLDLLAELQQLSEL